MPDEIDREVTTRKVTSSPNTPSNEYSVSEQRTSQVRNDDNSNGLILGILLVLAVGTGAAAYFMNNNRPAPTQILAPANNTVRENKSTVIERNNTTTREVAPATTQPAPNVEINVPSSAPQPAPRVEINVPPAPATTSSPAATAQPQTTAAPRPTN